MIKEIFKALDYSDSIIISPDFDGLLSAAIINKHKPIKISGIYTLSKLIMLDDTDPTESVWVDHDIRNPKIVSIGCHAVYPEIEVNPLSFNPHRIYNKHPDDCFKGVSSKARDKFPFSTSVLLAHAYQWYPEDITSIKFLSHADSGHIVFNKYFGNVKAWSDVFYDDNLKKIKETSPDSLYESLGEAGYLSPSFQASKVRSSNEINYINNIRKMANLINNHIEVPEIKDSVSTSKFEKIVKRFDRKLTPEIFDIVNKSLSYAVTFGDRVSYTNGSI